MWWTKYGLKVLLIALTWLIGVPLANAQSLGTSRSLGGYGASGSGSMASMTAGSPMLPYAGSFAGFVPYRTGGGGSLTFSSRGTSAMGSARSSFSLSSMSSGMNSGSGGVMSERSGPGNRTSRLFGSGSGMGSMGAMRARTADADGENTTVMPPNFGYPFYQPPPLLGPSSTGLGMPSM